MGEEIDRLAQAMHMQLTYSMQMNVMMQEQINYSREMVTSFRMLGEVLKQVSNQFWHFSQAIRDIIANMKMFGEVQIGPNTLKRAIEEQFDGVKSASDTVGGIVTKFGKSVSNALPTTTEGKKTDYTAQPEKKGFFDSITSTMKGALEPMREMIAPISPINMMKTFGQVMSIPSAKDDKDSKLWSATKAPFKMMGEALSPLSKQFSTLAPQMAMTALVMEPIQRMLGAFFSAFEPILDVFEMLGELMGLILQPIINEVALAMVNLITNMMPLLPSIQEFATGLFNLIMPIFATINKMAETGATFGEAMAMVIGDALKMILDGLATTIPTIIEILMQIFTGLISFLPTFLNAIGPILLDFFNNIIQTIWGELKGGVQDWGERWFSLSEGNIWFWNWFD